MNKSQWNMMGYQVIFFIFYLILNFFLFYVKLHFLEESKIKIKNNYNNNNCHNINKINKKGNSKDNLN